MADVVKAQVILGKVLEFTAKNQTYAGNVAAPTPANGTKGKFFLPYTAEGGLYPDRTAEILVDKALRVAVAVYCYSDVERHPSNLLAKYEYRSIRMGAGLTNRDFEPNTYGM